MNLVPHNSADVSHLTPRFLLRPYIYVKLGSSLRRKFLSKIVFKNVDMENNTAYMPTK